MEWYACHSPRVLNSTKTAQTGQFLHLDSPKFQPLWNVFKEAKPKG